MCDHVFIYPPDERRNYNKDGLTLTGKCRICKEERNAYGMRYIMEIEDKKIAHPYGELDYLSDLR